MAVITNTASLEATQNGVEVYAVSNTANYTVIDQVAQATLTKTPETATLIPGTPLTVTLTIENGEAADLVGVTLRDVLDPGITYVEGSATIMGTPATENQVNFVGGVLTITPGVVVAAGQTLSVTFQVIPKS